MARLTCLSMSEKFPINIGWIAEEKIDHVVYGGIRATTVFSCHKEPVKLVNVVLKQPLWRNSYS